ncbi:unnamed protein product [Adineta ricciae]|uniref:NADP-dependent oxidoreductase domain-containing protein n=1 Tax=Adineta ricciae TaxID=249248 RepID=A0A813SLE1_ADIRI|nr:unnamed protein product [Adineta ricciae]CAF1579585.1 unnamed protein product [Adineta ricciae]
MPKRQLGKNGPNVSAIGLGMMGLSICYGAVASDEERFKILDRAIELGCTYFDTTDVYGDSEDLLGKYFKKYPQQRQKISADLKSFSFRGDAEYVHHAIIKSLGHLQLDYVALYYVHRIDPKVPMTLKRTIFEESIRAFPKKN